MSKTFPRKIVISPGYGAGISTWIHGRKTENLGYEVIEHPEVISWVEAGMPGGGEAIKEITARLWPDEEYICLLGFPDATVVTVHGPYKVEEYDGFESVTEKNDPEEWRN
jgi:hypothetical protein